MEYQDWNSALAIHFLQGVAYGSRIYLSVDDAALETIGREEFETEPLNGSWREDLIEAVRREVVRGDRLDLDLVQGYETESAIPRGVAFLSVCVLAAYEMASDEEVSETNYFRRLRDVLKFNDSSLLRPRGMSAGTEEPLWKRWNSWLIKQGYVPTAQCGKGSKTYINYPISQCLLRQADRDRLEKYFHEQKWTSAWDGQTLFSRLREKTQQFPEYLQKLLKQSADRYDVLTDAIQEVHQQWIEAGCPASSNNGVRRSRVPSPHLFAGLYRSQEDYEIEYYLYPKQKPQHKWDSVQIQYQGKIETLESDRPGWYLPIGNSLNYTDLENGILCKVTQPAQLKTLRLPSRNFWILVPDPDEPDAGAYGTWHSPQLGQPFILLCKQMLRKDLNLLRDERLVNWSNEITPFEGSETQWIELHNFQILSQTWQGIFIENWELKDALQPKVNLSISLSGGLRSPKQRSWLKGHAPSVTVFGFMPTVKLEVLQLPNEQTIQSQNTVPVSKSHPLNLEHIGSYVIRAIHGSNVAECFLRIESFNELQLCLVQDLEQHLEKTHLSNSHKLCGTVLY